MQHELEDIRVLVVDDDELSRHVVARRLLRWGYQPWMAASFAEALQVLENRKVGALVADIDMPGEGGLQLAHIVRGRWPYLPIFLLASQVDAGLWARATEAGARDVLAKHAGHADGLRIVLAAALGRGTEPREEDLQWAHSLRTPLTAVKSALDMLCGGDLGELPEAQRHFAAIARRNVDRVIFLVEELLETSARA